MKLIVGLGNPGLNYKGTRHNIGFSALESLGSSLKIVLKRDNSVFSCIGKGKFEGEEIILAEPLTYMNLSGKSVKALLKKFKAQKEDLLVVCDDMDLELGRIKLRPFGSAGGHNGLISIIDELSTPEFSRLRIGISRPRGAQEPADYVLSRFQNAEKPVLKEVTQKAVDCCISWISQGTAKTMNIFNSNTRR